MLYDTRFAILLTILDLKLTQISVVIQPLSYQHHLFSVRSLFDATFACALQHRYDQLARTYCYSMISVICSSLSYRCAQTLSKLVLGYDLRLIVGPKHWTVLSPPFCLYQFGLLSMQELRLAIST